MRYLVNNGEHQREYDELKERKIDNTNAKHVAFEHLRYIMQSKVVFMCDQLTNKDGIITEMTKGRLRFLQDYGIPNVKVIYEGIIAPQPNEVGRDELVEALDFLFKNKDDSRKVIYHKQFQYGFRIK